MSNLTEIELPLIYPPRLGETLFVGNAINLFLYGALTVQLYTYYTSFSKDRWPLKTIVYLIYVIETVYTVLLTYGLGQFLLTSNLPVFSLILVPTCGGIVALLTQAMYAYRIRALGRLKCIPWCIMAMIILEPIAIIALFPLTTMFSLVLILAWTSISLVIDVMVAGAMIWSLRKNTILSKQLKSKVTRLVYLTIGTGALTAAINLLTVTLFLHTSTLGPAIVLSKLYANSMMVFLNDRIPSSHGHDGHAMSNAVTLGSLHFRTVAGSVDTAQEQPGRCDDVRGTSGETAVKDPEQRSYPA
ncbi:hypothetical protein AX14_005568 [Amanita brunnescens Koide BX004]|nr:hypothetical protein AX14_005568 [Amanita brunnescens Koide BX004]